MRNLVIIAVAGIFIVAAFSVVYKAGYSSHEKKIAKQERDALFAFVEAQKKLYDGYEIALKKVGRDAAPLSPTIDNAIDSLPVPSRRPAR